MGWHENHPVPARDPLDIARRKLELSEKRLEHRQRSFAARHTPKRETNPLLVAVESELQPIVEETLGEIRKIADRDQRLMHLLALKAMLGSRVSGVVRGMAAWDNLRRVVPSSAQVAASEKQRELAALDSGALTRERAPASTPAPGQAQAETPFE